MCGSGRLATLLGVHQQEAAMSSSKATMTSGYTAKAIDQLSGIDDGIVKLAAAELGIESFGMQVLDLPAGSTKYHEHDHADDGQEEVYVVLRGSAEFEIDGERVPIDAGRMVRISARSRRKLFPGPDGVRVLAIGGTPGAIYERPQYFRLAVRS
jgi:mannose-6-phosphate isomerase-like protein (cupin superfamily)